MRRDPSKNLEKFTSRALNVTTCNSFDARYTLEVILDGGGGLLIKIVDINAVCVIVCLSDVQYESFFALSNEQSST